MCESIQYSLESGEWHCPDCGSFFTTRNEGLAKKCPRSSRNLYASGGEVTLTEGEMRLACVDGIEKKLSAIYGHFEGNTKRTTDWTEELEGALAEQAFAKATGQYWGGSFNTFHNRPDVGKYEVRHTWRPHGHLIVRPFDPEERPYALVVGKMGSYKVVGWIEGKDAKDGKYLKNPNGDGWCYMIPQEDLLPFKTNPETGALYA